MIIECERCRSKFNVDEILLKRGGSKVRCSLCKQVFTAYPPPSPPPGAESAPAREELEETVALDSPPILEDRMESLKEEEISGPEFEKAFKEALDEEPPVPVSLDQLPEEEEQLDLAEARGRASKIEEEVTKRDMEKKAVPKPEEAAPEAPVEAERPTPPKKARRSRFLPILLVLVVVLLGIPLGVYFFAPDLLPDSLSFLKPPQKQEVTDVGVSRLSFKDVKGSFIQTEKGGQVFLIQGAITNNYPKGRSFILVRGSLLDDKGKVVKTKMAYAGNSYSEEQVKTVPIEEINKSLKDRFGAKKSNFNIKPQASVPFTIIIEELPENLSEFTVEAVSSSPEQP